MVVTINVSPRQFRSGSLARHVEQALAASSLLPQRVCIEITEQTLLENSEAIVAVIDKLKSLGVRIAIDDFGIGYTSLSYISRITPSELKIDSSLVRDIAGNRYNAAIVRATIAMAHSLDMRVVTEGVETHAQQAFLRNAGCDMAQGFLYATPHPAVDFQRWLATQD